MAEKNGKLELHWRILIAMATGVVLGALLNALGPAPWVDNVASVGEAGGQIFLALLKMVVVPLVFSSLVCAVTGLRGQAGLRRLGVTTVFYYALTSVLAIAVGIVVTNIIRPGDGVDYAALMARADTGGIKLDLPHDAGAGSVWEVLGGIVFRMIPTNVLQFASDNRNMLSVIFFALVVGLFINKASDARSGRIATLAEDAFEIMMSMTQSIIQLAPYGICGYIMFVIASTGFALMAPLAWYALAVFLGLVFHGCVTLPLLVRVAARRSPLALFKSVWPALAAAFATASSNGALPLTMECMERAGIKRRTTSFVLPLGATVNMDGTALYEAAAVLFIAQMLGDLSALQQIVVAVTALLASVGAAGIPHAGTVMMVLVLEAVGLPTEAVLTILAVDRPLDMLRTTVNVWSDCVCAAAVDQTTA
jgi:Na+/H+-dicarboxylate symporter